MNHYHGNSSLSAAERLLVRSSNTKKHLSGLTAYDAVALSCHLLSPVSDEGEVVAAAKALLQEERGAAAAHLSVGDDGDAIA